MNPDLELLHPYPFEKLRALFDGVEPNPALEPIALSIGEPKHASPPFVLEVVKENLGRLANYPMSKGMPELREAIGRWLERRFQLASVNPETEILPVNGTREALFAFAQAVIDRSTAPLVISPNPFYQIYEGAALLAGAEPLFLNCTADNGYLPDFDEVTTEQWQRCQLLYLCTPGNPTGAIMSLEQHCRLIELAREHDFIIASDECYSEIYPDENTPPPGLLQACEALGDGFSHCVVFHSLSKRSNLPGLRSGFVAGDARVLEKFLRYRTYHGCAMPAHHQLGSIAAWSDEEHVLENRRRYREKFSTVLGVLGDLLEVQAPEAGFYLWPKTPVSDEQFARDLYAQQNVVVLPGRYLGRDAGGQNPGEQRVRMALVAETDQCAEAAQRIRHYLESL